MPTEKITRTVAKKVLETIDAGLSSGLGNNVPGEMCVEAAVCYALGLPHNDNPNCVLPELRDLKIRLNDKNWSSNSSRAVGLRRLGLAQLGSDILDGGEFLTRVVEMVIGKIVPRAIRSVAPFVYENYRPKLEEVAKLCETVPTKKSAQQAKDVVYSVTTHDTTRAYIAYNANNAITYTVNAVYSVTTHDTTRAYNTLNAITYAVNAVSHDIKDVIMVNANAVNAANAIICASDGTKDKELAFFAEEVVQILIAMNAPGCQWLDLAPLQKEI